MNNTLVTITQLFIRNAMKKDNTCVLTSVVFSETIHKNEKQNQSVKLCHLYHH